ncbi:DUF2304 domain-containing protein [Candidatus Parcubacteria bacterium]|nr:MAG: DUF2304 domain-containing protein [Candidatus Parcubacteria bacterium]
MFQIYFALIIVLFFLARTYWQKKKKKVSRNEFFFWFVFWLLVGLFILFIKKIDNFVAGLGFSASGIDVLSYLSIALIFYLIFKIIIKIEKIEKNVTELVRHISINNKK